MANGIQCGDFFVLDPMRYHNKLDDKKVEKAMIDGKWLLQEKKDGAFFQLMKNEHGKVGLFSRTVSKKTGEYVNRIESVPHIKKWAELYLPNDTTLLGEIYVNGGKSNDVTKIMGANTDKALYRQFNTDEFGGPVYYYVFDCLKYSGEDLLTIPFGERYQQYLAYMLIDVFDSRNGYVDYIRAYDANDENLYDMVNSIFKNGGEGAVLKYKNGVYEPGKRPTTAFKLKEHIDSIDLVCIDLLNPERDYTGKELETWPYWEALNSYEDNDNPDIIIEAWDITKGCQYNIYEKYGTDCVRPVTKHWYYGWKNAMILGAYDTDGDLIEICRVASGIDDTMREDMAKNPYKYIGNVVQISCMSVNKKDLTVRHPVFEKMREDKNPRECIVDEIF